MHDEQAVRAAGVRVDVMAAGRPVLKALSHDGQNLLRGGHICGKEKRGNQAHSPWEKGEAKLMSACSR